MLINFLSLQYKNEDEANAFFKSKIPFNDSWIKYTFLIQIIQVAYTLISKLAIFKIEIPLYFWFLSFLPPIAELAIYFIIIRKYPKTNAIFLCFELLFLLIFSTEGTAINLNIDLLKKSDSKIVDESGFIFFGLMVGLLLNLLCFLSKASFHWKVLFGSVGQFYSTIRITNLLPQGKISNIAIMFVVIFVFTYINDQGEKLIYHENQNHWISLEQLYTILNEKFQSPIIIMSREKGEPPEHNLPSFNQNCKSMIIDLFLQNKSFINLCEISYAFKDTVDSSTRNLQPVQLSNINEQKLVDNQRSDSLLSQDQNPKFMKFFERINFKSLKNNDKCKVLQIKDNEIKCLHFHIITTPISYKGKETELIIFEDITSFKELDDFKDRLLATVSHDLRTPLQGCMGMIESSLECENMTKIKKQLKNGLKAAKGLQILVGDLLDYSQFINGKLSVKSENSNLVEIVKDVAKILKFQAKSRGILYKLNQKLSENTVIMTDPNRLKQILYNLIGNSLKFTGSGGKIEINVDKIVENNQSWIQIDVFDTGIGIKEENLNKLFKMFGKISQEDKSINKQGIGLGLYISNLIAKLLNTDEARNGLKVESKYGEGTKFQFYLPIENEEEDTEGPIQNLKESLPFLNSMPKTAKKIVQQTIEKKQNQKCLVVEDDHFSMTAILNYLDFFQIEHLHSQNGVEALKTFANEIKNKKAFDFILMDNEMPMMTGVETSIEITKLLKQQSLKTIPIIMLSGDVVSTSPESGIIKILQKPVSRVEIGNVIDSLAELNQ